MSVCEAAAPGVPRLDGFDAGATDLREHPGVSRGALTNVDTSAALWPFAAASCIVSAARTPIFCPQSARTHHPPVGDLDVAGARLP